MVKISKIHKKTHKFVFPAEHKKGPLIFRKYREKGHKVKQKNGGEIIMGTLA